MKREIRDRFVLEHAGDRETRAVLGDRGDLEIAGEREVVGDAHPLQPRIVIGDADALREDVRRLDARDTGDEHRAATLDVEQERGGLGAAQQHAAVAIANDRVLDQHARRRRATRRCYDRRAMP
jgi:hypothetical protein